MRLRGGKFGIVLFVALALVPTAAILPAGAATVPAAPAKPTAAALNASARVTWVAPANGGSPINHYIVTPFIGATPQMPPRTFDATAVSRIITGLTNMTTYTFKVKAQNGVGTGANSPASNPVRVGTPAAPGKPKVAPGNEIVRVNWVAPAPNGAAITGYVVTPFIGSLAQPPRTYGPALAELVMDLENGTSYTFKVAARNIRGLGPPSVMSLPVKPTAQPAIKAVMNATIGQPILVDNAGSTLYLFVPDADATPTISNVLGGLRVAWPYAMWAGPVTVGAGLDVTKAAAFTQPDNTRLLSYNGHLLYYFVNHLAPGDVAGQGLANFFVLDASGNQIP